MRSTNYYKQLNNNNDRFYQSNSFIQGGIEISNYVSIEAFTDFVSGTERASLKDAISNTANASSFQPDILNKLICVLSRFGRQQVPMPSSMIVQAACYEFCIKPAVALTMLHSGVPPEHKTFWQKKSPEDIYVLHSQLVATTDKVITLLESSDAVSPVQQCIYD